jgi:hypothetical protein
MTEISFGSDKRCSVFVCATKHVHSVGRSGLVQIGPEKREQFTTGALFPIQHAATHWMGPDAAPGSVA